MEHYIFYCKLSLLAVLSLITACCMLSRRWYVNLAAFLACLSGETFLAHFCFIAVVALVAHMCWNICLNILK